MEHVPARGSNEYCTGCLCRQEENAVSCLNLCNSPLQTVLQVDKLFLCYICRRTAQQAELFLQNVQSNQILLENYHTLTESTIQLTRLELRTPHQLSSVLLDTLELGVDDSAVEDSMSVLHTRGTAKIKQEMKQESGLDSDYLDDDTDFQNYVKEEDFLLKEELELEEIDLKRLKKSLKKGKSKRSRKENRNREEQESVIKKEVDETCDIETIYITREQCLEERERMAVNHQYLLSTYKCQDCVKGFNYKDSYDKHREKHSESNGEYECDICRQRMRTEDKLISHKRYHEVRYRCPACGLTRISRLTVKDHYSAFHTPSHHRHCCPHCPKTFKRQVSWRKHVANVHGRKRATCAYCNKSYANKDGLKAHMIVQHPKEKEVSAGEVAKAHACPTCGMAFRAPSQLRIHSLKHSLNKDYYCVECDKSFKTASILKHHLKTVAPHVSYTELPLACEHCSKRFAIRRDLERHTNRVHLNIKPFQCDRCDKAYVNAWSLNEHRRLVHEGFKRPLKYPCPMCDKVFDRNQVLKGHIRTHTGERPYQCSRCPAQFSQASILGTHVKLIHLRLTRDGRPKPTLVK